MFRPTTVVSSAAAQLEPYRAVPCCISVAICRHFFTYCSTRYSTFSAKYRLLLSVSKCCCCTYCMYVFVRWSTSTRYHSSVSRFPGEFPCYRSPRSSLACAIERSLSALLYARKTHQAGDALCWVSNIGTTWYRVDTKLRAYFVSVLIAHL